MSLKLGAMAFTDDEETGLEIKLRRFLESRRPSMKDRHERDVFFRIEGQSVFIFELIKSALDPSGWIESPFAKSTGVKASGKWKIYWMRKDMKWHRHPIDPEVESFEEVLNVLDADQTGCFWG